MTIVPEVLSQFSLGNFGVRRYMLEEWKDVKEFEGYYQISSYGRVKSLARVVPNSSVRGTKKSIVKERILIPSKASGGYLKVVFSKGRDFVFHHYVHRLVGDYFIPNEFNLPEINHKDGNKKNNNINNLEWTTRKLNQQHCVTNGLSKAILKKDDVLSIRSRYVKGKTLLKDLAKEYGVTFSCIWCVVSRKNWRNV